MAGCFGNHPIDHWMESRLDEYLDDGDDCEEETEVEPPAPECVEKMSMLEMAERMKCLSDETTALIENRPEWCPECGDMLVNEKCARHSQ